MQYFASLVLLSLALVATAAQAEPYPLEYFALRDVISNVRLSPDGKQLAFMKIPNRDGNPIIEIYPTDDLSAKPFRVNAEPMEITRFYWVGDTSIVMGLRQQVRTRIKGFNQGTYGGRIALLNTETKQFKKFDKELGPFVEHTLPNKPNKIILSYFPGSFDDSKLSEPIRPRSYYEFDLKRGSKKLILQGKLSLYGIDFDADGTPRTARGYDVGKKEDLWLVRQPGSKKWELIYRLHEDSFESFNIMGWDTENPHILFVRANNGHDIRGLWEYDSKRKTFGELIYRRPDVDVTGVLYHYDYWRHPDEVVAVAYSTDKTRYEYFDGEVEAVYRQMAELVPFSHNLRIFNISRDGESMLISNRGPRDPGSYYLLHKGQLHKVGSQQPLFKGEDLADVSYIKYQARDGRTIRAYLTRPAGELPMPLVVMPHGGPFVQEVVSYDKWGQLLANQGYLVLQPQYRGSHGYGIDFYTSAFLEDGGQGGYKMQDDKDDGALYLVEQGLADPDRMAMFGWSYGGYAALVAAARDEQIYQCVVAGAAVSDNLQQVNYYRDRIRGAGKIEQLGMWDDSISPIKQAAQVNVPMLIIHGDVDQRVPVSHSTKYIRELDRHHKEYKYLSLEGMDHFFDTMLYDHQLNFYIIMVDFLKNDCGPGGL